MVFKWLWAGRLDLNREQRATENFSFAKMSGKNSGLPSVSKGTECSFLWGKYVRRNKLLSPLPYFTLLRLGHKDNFTFIESVSRRSLNHAISTTVVIYRRMKNGRTIMNNDF
jgi:hypothetical protein